MTVPVNRKLKYIVNVHSGSVRLDRVGKNLKMRTVENITNEEYPHRTRTRHSASERPNNFLSLQSGFDHIS